MAALTDSFLKLMELERTNERASERERKGGGSGGGKSARAAAVAISLYYHTKKCVNKISLILKLVFQLIGNDCEPHQFRVESSERVNIQNAARGISRMNIPPLNNMTPNNCYHIICN